STARRLAESRLQTGFEVAEGDALAPVRLPGLAPTAHRRHAADLAGEDRDQHHSGAVVEVTDHLVTGRERERDDGLEVPRRVPVDGGEVGTADSREPGTDTDPAVRGSGRLVHVPQRQG